LPRTFAEQGYNDPYWPRFTEVKVYFQSGDFTLAQRNTIKQAFEAWDARRSVNCSGISFADSSYAVRMSEPAPAQVGAYAWVFKSGSSETDMLKDAATGTVFAQIAIGEFDIPEGVLLEVTKHELGHAYNLAHCDCDSIMNTTEPGDDITACDDASVKRHYCPPPTPTPTPNPTPSPYSCEEDCWDDVPEGSTVYCYDADPCAYPLTGGCPPGYANSGWACCCPDPSPVLVDVLGDGFNLTDAPGGVLFDLNSDGVRERISWTAAGSDDAWLALDRDGNGAIDNGRELFGNYTPQPKSVNANGFIALAEYDGRDKGGNGDGMINAADVVYNSLRLWRDANHNGVSDSDELHTLPSLNVVTFSLAFRESRRRDRWGNEFRYRARVYGNARTGNGRWAYDLFLLTAP
jgi:hypothetical protein